MASMYYPVIDFYEMESSDTRVIITHYPTYQQTTDYSCGPAVALTVLKYFNENNYTESQLMELMDSKPLIGTSLSKMIEFFKGINWNVESSLSSQPFKDEEEFKEFIIKNLSSNRPIMVENIDWNGHWRVIIGYDSCGDEGDVLILADPYDVTDHCQDGYVIESLDKFFSMWYDHNLLPEDERYQPWLVAVPKR